MTERVAKGSYVWMEEYAHCACTQVEERRGDLLGYCPKHAHDRKRVMKLPNDPKKPWELGHAHIG